MMIYADQPEGGGDGNENRRIPLKIMLARSD
jgi:hypothetical protein